MRLHVRLLVADFPKMLAFYRDTLGLAVTWSDDANYADLKAGDASLALFLRQGMDDALAGGVRFAESDRVVFVYGVDSVDETHDRLRTRGVHVESGPRDMKDWGIRVAHFRDPEGNLFEVNEPLPH